MLVYQRVTKLIAINQLQLAISHELHVVIGYSKLYHVQHSLNSLDQRDRFQRTCTMYTTPINGILVGALEPWNIMEFYDFPLSWECHHPN